MQTKNKQDTDFPGSPVVKFYASTTKDMGSTPGQGEILHALWP